jgi:chitinase
MIGVYFESWWMPWVSQGNESTLSKVEKPTTTVFLSFVKPDCTYKKGSMKWEGTGLQFSCEFKVIKESIRILRLVKRIKVFLSVGGATYHNFDKYNIENIIHLMEDLHIDGLDLDWEPIQGAAASTQFGDLIKKTRQNLPKEKAFSAAVFALGVLPPISSNPYQGVNLLGLQEAGHLLDFINVMAYDGGKELNVIASYDSYKKIFKNPVHIGFQVGKQGWGDALLTLEQVKTVCKHIYPFGDGCFIWAYFKDGYPTTKLVMDTADDILNPSETKLSLIVKQLEKLVDELRLLK